MDIRGETIQNGEPSPEHPVEIENKTNILLAIEILKKIKSKVTLVKVDDENNSKKEYRLPFLMNIEQQAIEHILSDYKRVLKENEILKEEKEQAWEEWNNLEQGSYETELKLKEENRELKAEMKDGVIAIKLYALQTENEKLKNKIEHYQKLQHNYIEKYDEINEGLQAMISALQELLESEE